MRFICLGYFDESKWNAIPKSEQQKHMEECFAYDDELRQSGNMLGGEALQCFQNTITLRKQNGKVVTTDGPYMETKEHLGGFFILEARDLNHAIALVSKHPGLQNSVFEVRALDEEIRRLLDARIIKK